MAKTYTAVPTVTAGDVYTASAYNTYTSTNVSNLIVPPMCKLVAATTQSVANSTDTTLTLGTSEIDTDSMGTTGAAAKITINTAGVYMVTYSATMVASAGGTIRFATVAKNGTGSPNAATGFFWASAPFTAGYSASWRGGGLLNLAVNDYLQLVVIQDSGGALNVGNLSNHTFLSAVWVGRTS